MDIVNQLFEVSKKWADLQVKTCQDWFEAVQKTDKFDPSLLLGKTVETSQASIQSTLDAEVEGSEIWFKGVSTLPGMPEETANFVEPVHGVAKQVIGLQQTLADNWFEFLRENDFLRVSGSVVEEEPVLEAAAA